MIHYKCRGAIYPRTNGAVQRSLVPDDKVSWEVNWNDYRPEIYTSESVKGRVWSDPELEDENFQPCWNSLDGKVDRRSFLGPYLVKDLAPLNPMGRTGLRGRGLLGRWGPNHAADPIVTRWKMHNGEIAHSNETNKPILQFVAIKRRDSGELAIPGGMVDPGEEVSITLKREFMEEALNSLEMQFSDKKEIENQLAKFFSQGIVVYKGYVDDPRNTDNSWMETVAKNFHDEDGSSVGLFKLKAGDDAVGVCWLDISKHLKLYASHIKFIEKVANIHKAHW